MSTPKPTLREKLKTALINCPGNFPDLDSIHPSAWEAAANAVADAENEAIEQMIAEMFHDSPSFEVESTLRMLSRKIAARRSAR